MASFHVITNSKILVEAIQHILKFVRIDWRVVPQALRNNFPSVPGDFIVAGDDEPYADHEALLVGLRKKNPLHPLVFIGGELNASTKARLRELQPLMVCAWPFNSKDFVDLLQQAADIARRREASIKKLAKVSQLLKLGKGKEAYALLMELKDFLDPSLFEVLKARAYWVAEKLTLALSCANKALEINPNSTEALEILAQIHDSMGQTQKAIDLLESHRKLIERDIDCMLLLADLHLKIGNLGASKSQYDKSLALDAHSAAARTGKFVVGVIDGSIKAVRSDKSAAQTSLELAKICNEKAIALVKAKQFHLAETLYLNTINLLPDRSVEYKLLLNLGLCMKKGGNLSKALAYFQDGKQKSPPGFGRFDEQIADLAKPASSA